MRLRPTPLLALAVACLAVLAGPIAGSQARAVKTVTLRNIAFSPKRLTVARNTTVTFSWRDGGTTHNVTSIGRKRFKSIPDRSAGSRSVRFTRAGTYRYECTLHPGMTGTIVVH
ncbi:MAG TPA: cupredoxin domain-containing protein [Solirubrobacteraceae bacterium]|nr:cupredoxin domain-containing protein [Solirubrobacteraceae bacterium]